MRAGGVLMVAVLAASILGCNGREQELEKERARLVAATDSLNTVIGQRDAYFDEVVRSINAVYSSLEEARQKEAVISQQAGEAEGKFSLTNAQARATLLEQISGIDASLKDSRKKIDRLQSRIKSINKEFAGLNETISNLKKMITEREQMIASLETRVTGLETEVTQKTRLIAVRDSIIGTQDGDLNTVYYVTGTREELEEKGIIKDEGGFPWGLFGSTTVLASGVDQSYFETADLRKEHVIMVNGTIDEIVPKREEMYYAMDIVDESRSDLTITDPPKFWQDRFLVIITE